jgi:hypothetical protein
MKDSVFWILTILFILLIVGIHLSQFTPLQIQSENTYIDDPNKWIQNVESGIENFTTKKREKFTEKSSLNEVNSGASTLYKFGLPEDKNTNIEIPLPEMPDISFDWEGKHGPASGKSNKCEKKKRRDECEEEPVVTDVMKCRNCDITLNKDIDKYVLKSSVPPCPDMSEYVKKGQMNPDINMNDYIKKSDIQPCPHVDLSEYIRKSDIPACPAPVQCPTCPECPLCPKGVGGKCKEIREFNITEHPDMKDYIKKSEAYQKIKKLIEENYMLKKECIQHRVEKRKEDREERREERGKNGVVKQWNTQFKPQEQPVGLYVGDSLFASV